MDVATHHPASSAASEPGAPSHLATDVPLNVTSAAGDDLWAITLDLTDRWGDINTACAQNKPLDELTADPVRLQRLRDQMWDEITFIVRKDGQFGLLYEVEYLSVESEDRDESPPLGLLPFDQVKRQLLVQCTELSAKYPGVQFAVPDPALVYKDRPAIWGFAADGVLDAVQRESLGRALLAYAYPSNDQEHPDSDAENASGMRP